MFAAALLLLTIHTLTAQPTHLALPACDAPTYKLATRTEFTICFDTAHKVPAWTAYQLTPQMLNTPAIHRMHFRHDPEITESATDTDYRNSGFHRSHLVPAIDLASNPEALHDSYLLSNAVPQLPQLNLSAWRKIENAIRRLAAHNDNLFILTGTLFDCETIQHIGPNQIAVPCATYKAVLATQGDTISTFAVILPNHSDATPQIASIRQIEHRTGFDFFSSLPASQQNTLEQSITPLP